MRIQPRLVGKSRIPAHGSLSPRLERAIRREQERYDCSRAFVITTCCAFALGIDDEPDYKGEAPRRK